MNNIKVSVIIPIYNSERYLRECLDSVFNQSFDLPYEVIASINGSTDCSIDILKEYKEKYSNLIILEAKENLGAASARIKGVEASKGDYIVFIDSDDLYHPDFLKVMYKTIEEGYDVVGCSYFFKYAKHSKKSILRSKAKLDSVHAFRSLLRDVTIRGYMWNKIYRRELFTNYKVYYPKDKKALFEDTVSLSYIYQNIKSYKSIKNRLYYYRKNQPSATTTVNKERFNQHLNAFAFIRHMADQNPNPAYREAFKKTYWRDWTSLFFDAYVLRKELHHGPFIHLRINKAKIKLLKNEKPLPVKGEVWEQYINDCLA